MNNFNLNYDEEQEVPPHLSNDPSYMSFSGQDPNYAFGSLLPHDSDPSLQSFERPQPDLEGRMSHVMLNYDQTSGLSMPMNLDPTNAFAYNAPTYPSTTMGTMGIPQFQSTYPPFQQSMAVYSQPVPLARKDQYDTSTDSAMNFEDSGFSARNSDRSQLQAPRIQRRVDKPQPGPRTSQPVAIQPKKPPPAPGEFSCARHGPSILTKESGSLAGAGKARNWQD